MNFLNNTLPTMAAEGTTITALQVSIKCARLSMRVTVSYPSIPFRSPRSPSPQLQ